MGYLIEASSWGHISSRVLALALGGTIEGGCFTNASSCDILLALLLGQRRLGLYTSELDQSR
jgi:hypothetical protein